MSVTLDAVPERDAGDEFRQLILAFQPPPGLRRRHEVKRTRSPPSPPFRSRSLARRTATGPIPVWIIRSGAYPCRTRRSRSSGSRASRIPSGVQAGFHLPQYAAFSHLAITHFPA